MSAFLILSTCSADMFAHEEGGPEPDWVKTEREQFSDFRDLNKDGKMDQDEIRHWIMPQDYDHAQAEARHLVYESDQDKVYIIMFQISFWSFCVQPRVVSRFKIHPSLFRITVVHLKMLILQLPCLQISGPDADQRGDP